MCKRGEFEMLEVPEFVYEAQNTTPNHKQVRIDKCMVGQVKELWEAGVVTYGCCCQHGDPVLHMPQEGFISIYFGHLEKAERLGFKKYNFQRLDPTAPCHALKPKLLK